MKYAVEVGSDAMIEISNFLKTGSAIPKLMAGVGDIVTHKQHGDRTSQLLFF
jgi:hypothetical protein